jgi:hypothetical protein
MNGTGIASHPRSVLYAAPSLPGGDGIVPGYARHPMRGEAILVAGPQP